MENKEETQLFASHTFNTSFSTSDLVSLYDSAVDTAIPKYKSLVGFPSGTKPSAALKEVSGTMDVKMYGAPSSLLPYDIQFYVKGDGDYVQVFSQTADFSGGSSLAFNRLTVNISHRFETALAASEWDGKFYADLQGFDPNKLRFLGFFEILSHSIIFRGEETTPPPAPKYQEVAFTADLVFKSQGQLMKPPQSLRSANLAWTDYQLGRVRVAFEKFEHGKGSALLNDVNRFIVYGLGSDGTENVLIDTGSTLKGNDPFDIMSEEESFSAAMWNGGIFIKILPSASYGDTDGFVLRKPGILELWGYGTPPPPPTPTSGTAPNPVYIYGDDIIVEGTSSPEAEAPNMFDEVRANADHTISYQISPVSVKGVSMTATAVLHLQYKLAPQLDWQNITKPDGSELKFTLATKPADGSDWCGQVRGFNGQIRLAITDTFPTVYVKAAIRG